MEINQQAIESLITKGFELTVTYVPKVLLAILVFYVGSKMASYISSLIGKGLDKRGVDKSLKPFLEGIIGTLLKLVVIIASLGMVGIETTSFVAVLGAAGLAVGLALQGSLGNFAGGVLILIFRPFNVGDVIEAQGFIGVVKEIHIFFTTLTTPDNKVIIIPNGDLSGGNITNYSKEKYRRVDLVFGIDYSDDLKKAQEVLLKVMNSHDKILNMEGYESFARVGELGDNSVNFTVRAWVKTEDYWDVHFDLIEKVKLEFDKEGLSFPFPQRDVHIKNS